MTDKQKKMAYAMLVDGFSLHEVAEATRLEEKVVVATYGCLFPELRRKRSKVNGIYIGLEKWIEETKISGKKLADLIGRSPAYLLECRKHSRNMQFKIDEVELLLDITGMTFEGCFAKRKAPEEAATSSKG